MIKQENHLFTGLQKDITVSKQQPEYLIDAHNIRITAREGETLLSITNEKGPQELSLVSPHGDEVKIKGTILGHCVINKYLVLFTHEELMDSNGDEVAKDSIYRLDLEDIDAVTTFNMFQGETTTTLGFNTDYPIEAISDYENEHIQKVYFTDGINQPRVINIADNPDTGEPRIYTWEGAFDFVPKLQLNESVSIEKNTASNGSFASGVIQYAFTYYNLYGQESNVFYTTPLYNISPLDRGAAPDEIVNNAFTIKVDNLDPHFDFIRIYSIQRTSLNATPICKVVQDIQINNNSGTRSGTVVFVLTPNSEDYSTTSSYNIPNIDYVEDWYELTNLDGQEVKNLWKYPTKSRGEYDIVLNSTNYHIDADRLNIDNNFMLNRGNNVYTEYKATEGDDLFIISNRTITYNDTNLAAGDSIKIKLAQDSITPIYFETYTPNQGYTRTESSLSKKNDVINVTLGNQFDRLYCTIPAKDIVETSTFTLTNYSVGDYIGYSDIKGVNSIGSEVNKVIYRILDSGEVKLNGTTKVISGTYSVPNTGGYAGRTIDIAKIYVPDLPYIIGDTIKTRFRLGFIDNLMQGAPYVKIGYYSNNIFVPIGTKTIISARDSYFDLTAFLNGIPSTVTELYIQIDAAGLFSKNSWSELYTGPLTWEIENIVFSYKYKGQDVTAMNLALNDIEYQSSVNPMINYYYQWRLAKRIGETTYNLFLFENTATPEKIKDYIYEYFKQDNPTYTIYSRNTDTGSIKVDSVYYRDYTLSSELQIATINAGHLDSINIVDNGTIGRNVSDTDLLYVGGEEITAQNLCTKDGTLFLGNILVKRPYIQKISNADVLATSSLVTTDSKEVPLISSSSSSDEYYFPNGLNGQAAGFKVGETYRLGFQAQYCNGKWSEPVFIRDYDVSSSYRPTISNNVLNKTVIKAKLQEALVTKLKQNKYVKVRPVVVFPELQDRNILCQGVANPTMYTDNHRLYTSGSSTLGDNDLTAQSSWFFRPLLNGVDDYTDYYGSSYYSNTACSPYSVANSAIHYTDNSSSYNPVGIRGIEIQGQFNNENKFKVDWNYLTLHSPEFEFSDDFYNLDLGAVEANKVGDALFSSTLSDIDIQTSTPSISNSGAGFVHKSFNTDNSNGIISGLFYDDYIVDNDSDAFFAAKNEKSPLKWMVYPWQKTGSLNNDLNRPSDKGTRSAVLSKKIISNLRYATTSWLNNASNVTLPIVPKFFSSDQVAITKLTPVGNNSGIYMGNIDTSLTPDKSSLYYFAFTGTGIESDTTVDTPFTSNSFFRTGEYDYSSDSSATRHVYKWNNNAWGQAEGFNLGWQMPELGVTKGSVRMKYKSSPHLVLYTTSTFDAQAIPSLPILELTREATDEFLATKFGGNTKVESSTPGNYQWVPNADALKSNKWLPAGEPVSIVDDSEDVTITFEYGDTWYSRYDCLKTYPFTQEDINQIVEIGSFLLETRINIDGRYDKNRGQLSNLYMSPKNFNLYNPVYSQRNNYFTYQILDADFYKLNHFPNQITWTLEKLPGSEVDNWTDVTLAATHSMDGGKGEIRALEVWNNNIYCFQDNAISNILFNSRVQIPTSDGTPIEITNNYKVDGKRYISDGIGCINKYSICPTPFGLYFIDSVEKHLQAISANGLSDISLAKNVTVWFSKLHNENWTGSLFNPKIFYDKNKLDLYIINSENTLIYNESLQQFTSFMSYKSIPVMFNVLDSFYCVNRVNREEKLYQMFAGDYNDFFGEIEGFDFSFTSNQEGTQDKIFENLEFRADAWSDDTLLEDCPFNYMKVWNEYQNTDEVPLIWNRNVPSNLKKKFRVWRIQIPRDSTFKRDRIRNTWTNIQLGWKPKNSNISDQRIQFHDIAVQYFV